MMRRGSQGGGWPYEKGCITRGNTNLLIRMEFFNGDEMVKNFFSTEESLLFVAR